MIKRVAVIALCLATQVRAEELFYDGFDDLSAWTGKNGGPHTGVVVDDPLRPGNSVLSFFGLTTRGDVHSREIEVSPDRHYQLEFEYLGIPGRGVDGDLGGAIGFSDDLSFPGGQHIWLDATVATIHGPNATLIDDGTWKKYIVELDPFDPDRLASPDLTAAFYPTNNTIRLIIEDFSDSGGVAGDVYFDNIRVLAGIEPCPPSKWIQGDADRDGTVGFSDFVTLAANLGQEGDWSQGDFDCDGQSTFQDFLLLALNFGDSAGTTNSEATSVPEPGGTLLLMVGAVALLRRLAARNTSCLRPSRAHVRSSF